MKQVLGAHVNQAGSYVGPDRLRFDFSHFSQVTAEELKKVEAIVNEQVLAGKAVNIEELPIEEAKKKGATALFGRKIRQYCSRCYRSGLLYGVLRR